VACAIASLAMVRAQPAYVVAGIDQQADAVKDAGDAA
jgi:hypothetical protein